MLRGVRLSRRFGVRESANEDDFPLLTQPEVGDPRRHPLPLFYPYALPFFVGIVTGIFLPLPLTFARVSMALGVALFALFVLLGVWHRGPFLLSRIYYALILCGGVLLGLGQTSIAEHGLDYRPLEDGRYTLVVRVEGEEKRWPSGFTRCVGSAIGAWDTALLEWHDLGTASVDLLFRKGLGVELERGAVLMVYGTYRGYSARLSEQRGLNPHAFSFERWQRRQGTYGEVWVEPLSVSVLEGGGAYPVSLRERLQSQALDRLGAHGLSPAAYGLSAALGVADRGSLDRDIRTAFSAVGIAHILALSGLHVGMVFGLVALSCRVFSGGSRGGRLLRYGLPLLVVWLFSAFVGLSSSLLRAAVMLSAFYLPMIFYRRLHPFDSLTLAAVVILLLDPLQIGDVGFQLSFSAVLGIFLYNRWLSGLLRTHRPRVLVYLVDIVLVSLSAQIGTLPFILYHFGRFPLVGLLANVYAIPLITLILPFAFLLILLPYVPIVSPILACVQNFLVGLLVDSSLWLSSLPWAELTGLRIGIVPALLLGVSLWFIGYALRSGQRGLAAWSPLSLLPFLLVVGLHVYSSWHSSEYVVFHKSKGTLVAFREGREVAYLSLGRSEADSQILRDYASSIVGARFSRIDSSGLALLCGFDLDILSGKGEISGVYLLTSQAGKCSPFRAHGLWETPPRLLVLDGGVGYRARCTWEQYCDSVGIAVWWTGDRGAYVECVDSP